MPAGASMVPMTFSLALETNGRGCLVFLGELPGAFVRGATETEALAKVQAEALSYARWAGIDLPAGFRVEIAERCHTKAVIEDGDTEILLAADRCALDAARFADLAALAAMSGRGVAELFTGAAYQDWVDEERIRRTFYGENPRTLREIIEHLTATHDYYLSRLGIDGGAARDFLPSREWCISRLAGRYRAGDSGEIRSKDGEEWTLAKVLRRLIWHDRIHAKAMVRILIKQRRYELISDYSDPFGFFSDSEKCP